MSRVSKENFKKIAESVLSLLYEKYPVSLTTRAIARDLARDKEFIVKVMKWLEGRKLVQRASKGYARWMKWRLSVNAKKRFDALAFSPA